jgi:NADH-quinone oxidoreductase subunit J
MHDLIIPVIFYVLSAIAIISAFFVITQNNPVRCVLFLVLTFFASAGIWLLAEAEFLALILILVYVGAVMTLFLFVVMMLNIDIESIKGHLLRYLPFGTAIVALFVALLVIAIPADTFKPLTSVELTRVSQESISNTEALGLVLYTDYFLAFELAAVLLLVAIVSAITLVHRGPIRSKQQDVRKQLMTRSEDRVQLVSMKAEK